MALIIELKVIPSSGRHGWFFDTAGRLRCYLKKPAERGQANQELISLVAQKLKLPQVAFTIISGITIPRKRLKIETNLTLAEVCALLGLEIQQKIK